MILSKMVGSGLFQLDINVTVPTLDIELHSYVIANSGWDGSYPVTINFRNYSNIGSSSINSYALTINSNFPAQTIINCFNYGVIAGHGGHGENWNGAYAQGGGPGGPALYVSRTIYCTNTGTIGGGGGGGAGWATPGDGNDVGGGGGAGYLPGDPGSNWDVRTTQVLPAAGSLLTGGSGGILVGYTGGYGGNLGQPGQSTPSGGSFLGGPGGNPGAAIVGNSNIVWLAGGSVLGPVYS
jgi:hypothetical protein